MVVASEELGGSRERTDQVGCERREARSGVVVVVSMGSEEGGVRDGRLRLADTVDLAVLCCRDLCEARRVRRSAILQWLHIVELMVYFEVGVSRRDSLR